MVHMDGRSRGRARPDQIGAGDQYLDFGVEFFTKEAIPTAILEAHHAEVGVLKGTLDLMPDWAQYELLQVKGELIFITARSNRARVAGYMLVILRPHLHYAGAKVAYDDAHYLTPKYRGGGWGKKMIQYAERRAKAYGAKVFSMRTKAGEHNHGYIFESLGYKLTDLVYLKDLTDGPP